MRIHLLVKEAKRYSAEWKLINSEEDGERGRTSRRWGAVLLWQDSKKMDFAMYGGTI